MLICSYRFEIAKALAQGMAQREGFPGSQPGDRKLVGHLIANLADEIVSQLEFLHDAGKLKEPSLKDPYEHIPEGSEGER